MRRYMSAGTMVWLVVSLSVTMGCSKKQEQTSSGATSASSAAAGKVVGKSAAAPASTLPKTDKGKLQANAAKILRFYKNKDVEALVLMTEPSQRKEATKFMTEGSPRYKSLFGEDSWRMKAVQAWDEKLGAVRVKGDRAKVKFGEENDRVFVVAFRKVDGNWWWADIKHPSKESFESWGTEAK